MSYSIENFIMKSVIKEDIGEWSPDIFSGEFCWNINYSDILTFLIQKAGTICEFYASDLFISWNSLVEEMKEKGKDYTGGKYLFGFRMSGVDHNEYIFSRLRNYGVKGLREGIEELYLLEVSVTREGSSHFGNEITMRLGDIDMSSLE